MINSDARRETPDDCADFCAHVGAHFAGVLEKYAFSLVECLCLHDGRECTAMYQSPRQRLLFELSDGAFHVLLGSRTTPFPGGDLLNHEGQAGWYALFLLVEFKSGQRVYTEKLIQQIWSAEADPYQVEANLFTQWADRLLPMFEPDQEATWREEFRRYHERKAQRRARWQPFGR